MTNPDHMRLMVAATAFLEVARREWVNRNPNQPCPIPVFEAMDLGTRRSFLKCVASALRASEPKNVQAIMERRLEVNGG